MIPRFAQPLALLLLALVPVLAWWAIRLRRSRAPRMVLSSTRLLPPGRKSLRLRLRRLPGLLIFGALALAIVALARPQIPWSDQKRKTKGISIMLVIDASETMRALDFKPNRLEAVKEVVKNFVAKRKDDLVGLVIFGRETFTLCPLTLDYDAFRTFLDRISFDLVDGKGTAIGMGLANGVNKIKDAPTKSKVIILLTDGENNWGEIQPKDAAELAAKLGIRVYAVGAGSEGEVAMPMMTPGGPVLSSYMSHIDEEALREVASITGGKYFHSADGESLEEIYSEIDRMERTRIETNETNYYDEMAVWMIVPALGLLLLAFLLEATWLRSFP